MKYSKCKCALVLMICIGLPAFPTFSAEPTRVDVQYAEVDGTRMLLDIYRPDEAEEAGPLIAWVHGGAWRSGSKSEMPLSRLLDHGFVIASVEYRLSGDAKFPANVHDIKAAIRFLKANARTYGIDKRQVFVAGASAGGHLAALVGVSNGHPDLEGSVGKHLDESSDVQGVVSFYGASNLQTILGQSTPHGISVRVPALELLLGGHPDTLPALAKLASPVAHVDRSDPPLLLIHGDQDPQMPINQSHELHGKFKQAGIAVVFEVVHGGTHGGVGFYEDAMLDRVSDFLKTGRWNSPLGRTQPETDLSR